MTLMRCGTSRLSLTEHFFKVLKRHHNHGHVVQRLAVKTIFEDAFDGKATVLVHFELTVLLVLYLMRILLLLLLELNLVSHSTSFTALPDSMTNFSIVKFVEDAVTAQRDEVMVLGDGKFTNFRFTFYHIWISTTVSELSLRVAKSSAN